MFNVYVVWSADGPIMTTLLQYEDTPEMRELVASWSVDKWISQAWDTEFSTAMEDNATYELAAIFTADNVNFIY